MGDEDGAGDVALVVLGLRANVEDDAIVLGIHELFCGFGVNLLIGGGAAAVIRSIAAVAAGGRAKVASEPGEGDDAREGCGD